MGYAYEVCLSVEQNQRQNRRICSVDGQIATICQEVIYILLIVDVLSRYNHFYGWNIRLRNFILWHKSDESKRSNRESTLHVQAQYKETKAFGHLNFYFHQPWGTKKGFVKGEALRLLWINSPGFTFSKNSQCFKIRVKSKGYQV